MISPHTIPQLSLAAYRAILDRMCPSDQLLAIERALAGPLDPEARVELRKTYLDITEPNGKAST